MQPSPPFTQLTSVMTLIPTAASPSDTVLVQMLVAVASKLSLDPSMLLDVSALIVMLVLVLASVVFDESVELSETSIRVGSSESETSRIGTKAMSKPMSADGMLEQLMYDCDWLVSKRLQNRQTPSKQPAPPSLHRMSETMSRPIPLSPLDTVREHSKTIEGLSALPVEVGVGAAVGAGVATVGAGVPEPVMVAQSV
jgi:hypothetical protein